MGEPPTLLTQPPEATAGGLAGDPRCPHRFSIRGLQEEPSAPPPPGELLKPGRHSKSASECPQTSPSTAIEPTLASEPCA